MVFRKWIIKMDEKAQGALEYLLLIGGAVLVAAIVLTLMAGLAGTGQSAGTDGNTSVSDQFNILKHM